MDARRLVLAEAPLHARVGPVDAVLEVEGCCYLRVDERGRWQGVGWGDTFYRRTVDGRVVRRVSASWSACDEHETAAAHELAHELARVLGERVRDPRVAVDDAPHLAERLALATAWTPARLVAEEGQARRAYPEPVEVLPPHRYRDLVVQPATGCPNHACTFCAFYRDRPFRVLDDDAFERHLEAVQRVLGAGAFRRSGIFLGSGSAGSLPDEMLLARLARLREVFGAPRRGVAAFFDPDHAPVRPTDAWRALARAGLVDLTLGLETAVPSVRRRLGKCPDLVRFADAVARVKGAGVRLALTVLIGPGPAGDEAEHRSRTCAWIGAQPLDVDDLVYLSPLKGDERRLPVPDALAAWRSALTAETAARVALYDIDRFAWLT